MMKTEGRLFDKIGRLTKWSLFAFIFLFICTTTTSVIYLPHLTDRFMDYKWLLIVPFMGILCIANVPRLLSKQKFFNAFVFSSFAISFFLIVVAIELYPSILITSLDPSYDITIYEAASSEKTLGIMLGFVAIGGPLVLAYTYFVYRTFRGKVILDESSY